MNLKEALEIPEKIIKSRSASEIDDLKIKLCHYLSDNSKIINEFTYFIDSIDRRKRDLKNGMWMDEIDTDILSITSLIQHVSQKDS